MPEQLPFQEAIVFFKNKIKLPSSGWTDIWQEQHSHAFVVAGAASDALVEDLYNAIVQAKRAGGAMKSLRPRLKASWQNTGGLITEQPDGVQKSSTIQILHKRTTLGEKNRCKQLSISDLMRCTGIQAWSIHV